MNNSIKSVLVLGSGALKIGQAGEFDYSGSQALKAFKEAGLKTILVNPNIATIQTSKHLADQIYFLPVTPYFVTQIIKKEQPDSICLSFGGQTALNCGIALHTKGILKKYHVQIMGTPIDSVITTEDRQSFARHMKSIHQPIPQSSTAKTAKQAFTLAQKIGFPVMIRAAYALGGQSSGTAQNSQELELILADAFAFSPQVLVEKYLHHYKEIEYEVVRDEADNCITVCNMENFDPLGIHTGESIVVAPSQTLNNHEYHTLRQAAINIVKSLKIVGECNVQFALNPHPLHSSFFTSSRGLLDSRSAAGPDPDKRRGSSQPKNKYQNNKLFPYNTMDNITLNPLQASEDNNRDVNLQISVDQPMLDYYVIEVNARLSRSSALASKATGYPLAYVAAKLSLGHTLPQIKNQITKTTSAFFEPALDYLAVKMPRWDLHKFKGAHMSIGSSMKSVGEVMALGRTFEETIQKAVRMLDIGVEGVTDLPNGNRFDPNLSPTPDRLFQICQALLKSNTVAGIYKKTGINPWFLNALNNIVTAQKTLSPTSPISTTSLPRDEVLRGLTSLKKLGFSDQKIAQATGTTANKIRTKRKKLGITPSVFQIDTLAGEFPAQTNYLYTTYHGNHHDVSPLGKKGVIVLGSGTYRIGSSVEFDWATVFTAQALKCFKKHSIIINCNPETVSTDYDISDRLYFEELTQERVQDIYDFEHPQGIIISVGGQTPNNLAIPLNENHCRLFGTQAKYIDIAEDRNKFSALLDSLSVEQPAWTESRSLKEAATFATKVGYPVLIRPSYVLSGSAMNVCYTETDLTKYLKAATIINHDHPVTISKFQEHSKEIELDGIASQGKIIISAISEHIEHAGIHSGDASIVYPAQKIYLRTEQQIHEIAQKLAAALKITGPFNIQFLARDNQVSVIELNCRASRTLPFISKATGTNFANLITEVYCNRPKPLKLNYPKHVAVKVPQFSFARIQGADPALRVEMASTGEAACFGDTLESAFLKAEISVGATYPKKGVFISLGGDEHKVRFLDSIFYLKQLGLPIYATEKTCLFLKRSGVKAKKLYKIHEGKSPNTLTAFQSGKIDLAINIVDPYIQKEIDDDYVIRRNAIDHNIYLLTNRRKATVFIKAISEYKLTDLDIQPWKHYVPD